MDIKQKNRRLGLIALGVAVTMLGLAYAAVPFYNWFCRVTGFGGTPQISESASGITPTAEQVTVRFNSDISPELPWTFTPDMPQLQLAIGEEKQITYTVTNNGTATLTGLATYNVTPDVVGKYFNKTICFCFQNQTIASGESKKFLVQFFVDPEMLNDPDTKNIKTITLSYTFFKAKE